MSVARFVRKVACIGLMFSGAILLQGQAPQDRPMSPPGPSFTLTCPGAFPSDLTVFTCEYNDHMRIEQWVTTSITDQAILGAIVYGTGAEINPLSLGLASDLVRAR